MNPLVRKVPWRRERQSTPVFFPGEFHGQRLYIGHGAAKSQLLLRFPLYLGFQQFESDVPRCAVFCVCVCVWPHTRASLAQSLLIEIFQRFWKVLSHYLFHNFFCAIPSHTLMIISMCPVDLRYFIVFSVVFILAFQLI